MENIDSTDKEILRFLQEDAKMDIKLIADRLNITKTPVYERIRKLEQKGIISKYVAIIDRKKIDTSMIIYCFVSLDMQSLDKIEQFENAITKVEEVMECYLLGGAHDFLLKIVVKDLDAYHHFSSGILAALPHVTQIKSSFVLNEIKHSTVLPTP